MEEQQNNTTTPIEGDTKPIEEESSTTSNITLEDFKTMLEGNLEVKGYFDSEVDKTVSKRLDKAVESWKSKNLQNIVEAEIEKRYPKKTESEIKFEEKVKELEQLQEEKRQLELKMKYQDEVIKNGLDPKVLKFVVGENMDTTLANIKEFKEILNKMAENMTQEVIRKKIGEISYKQEGSRDFNFTKSIWE